ncbi:TRAP transporter small permease subunit [Sporosarcina sp. FA9]|uniref:TRAP transporter small permease subunit n=1 Tax=Sporosarcina sp. FA9 TaxID=3413030 RepID=UPI003F65E467
MLLNKITSFIDLINDWAGKIARWLVLILAIIIFYEVNMRYLFNKPSIWVFDISYMLGGTFFTLGMGYTLLKKKHVRVDVFYTKFKKRSQAAIDIFLTVFIFFPTFILMLTKLIPWVQKSWERKEKAIGSFWMPPVYPFKTILLISILLLMLQAFSELCKSIQEYINEGKKGGNKE